MATPTFLTRLWNGVMEFDSTIDAGIFGLGRWLGDRWRGYSEAVDRMRISGFKRVAVDLISDGMTFAAGISVLIYAWGLPTAPNEKLLYSGTQEYSMIFTDRNGRFIGRRGIRHNDAIPLDEIPEHVISAVLATEDERFHQHFGVDIIGTTRAMFENVKANDIVQGGSSITQQLAKNLYLSPDQTIERKVKEAFFALWIEARLSKREILKLYIDRAYMGGGAIGLEAASEFYFDKSVRDVNIAEAAMLAGLFKAPSKFAPHNNLPASRERANTVLERMVDAGFITEGQARVARLNPAQLVPAPDVYTPEHYLDWAFTEAKRIADGRAHVLVVKTTLDLSMQKLAEEAVASTLRDVGDARRIGDAAMVSLTMDGAVRALVGGKDYAQSQFNRAVNAKRQPGSSWKPFVYLAALENGFTPKTVINDGPICIRGWCPNNYSRRYRGRVTLTTALQKSINTVPVRLAQKITRKKIAEAASRLGIRTELRLNLSMPLGTNEVTVLDMTGAYASIGTGGIKVTPHAVMEIRTQAGEVLYNRKRHEAPPKRVIEAKIAEDLNFMMSQIVIGGTGRRAQLDFTSAAGKTGTTQAYRDAWFVGYTGELATGVWMGNDNFLPTRRVTGGSFPAQTWHKFMAGAHSDKFAKTIPGVKMIGRPKPVESEAAKATRLAGLEENRVRQQRKISALAKINELFQKGLLGPVRGAEGTGQGSGDDRASIDGTTSAPGDRVLARSSGDTATVQ